MTTEEGRIAELFSAFVKASNAILLKSFHRTRSYAEVVADYRRLELEFVAKMGDDEFGALETKRHVAESILSLAHGYPPSFDVCREAFHGLVRLGFTNLLMKCMESWLYADICAYDEQPEEGLAVLDPLITELEQWLKESRATQRPTLFYEDELQTLKKLRDELEAQRMGQISPERITRRIFEAHTATPEERRINEVYDAIWEARRAVYKAFARSRHRTFAQIADDYRQVEADIVARAGACDAFQGLVGKVRQYIAEDGLRAACGLEQPFDVCRQAWDEVVRVGFTSTSRRWKLTEMYAETCALNDQPEAGLAAVEPLMAEITRLLEKPKKKLQPPPRCTRVELERQLEDLGELRDKLEAKRRGGEAST
jgi:hypothetical protein